MKKLMSIIISILFALSMTSLSLALDKPVSPAPEKKVEQKKADKKKVDKKKKVKKAKAKKAKKAEKAVVPAPEKK